MKRTIAVTLCAASVAFSSGAAASAADTSAGPHKKTLVVYYSRTGNTQRVAEDLANKLGGADLERLVDHRDRSGVKGYLKAGRDAAKGYRTEIDPPVKDPAAYDLVVIGTPVWAWTMSPAVRTYIEDKKAGFKKVAFFTTAGGTKPEKVVRKMAALAGKEPVAFAGFFQSDLKPQNNVRYGTKLQVFAESLQ